MLLQSPGAVVEHEQIAFLDVTPLNPPKPDVGWLGGNEGSRC